MRNPGRIVALCLLVAAATVTACGTTTGPSPTTAPTSSLNPPLPGQTDADWGRIWDTVPADFPAYPGSATSEETPGGPASATLAVDGNVAKEAAAWMDRQLVLDGDAIESLSGPLEDGSYVLEAERQGGCRVQVTVAPLGSLTTITILYGASCPNT